MRNISIAYSLCLYLLIFSCNQKSENTESSRATESEIVEVSDDKLILFFGNSLTAGYGIEAEDAFPGLVAQRIDSLGLEYSVINGGLSGETTASGLSRLEWFLEEEPHVFVLELGANDGLRGIDLSETRKNLKAIINAVKEKYPTTNIILAGMQIPPNMGQAYTREFQAMYPAIAAEENVDLIPFLLEDVAGDPDLNLPDGIHPTEAGHKLVFQTIWPYIQKYIE